MTCGVGAGRRFLGGMHALGESPLALGQLGEPTLELFAGHPEGVALARDLGELVADPLEL